MPRQITVPDGTRTVRYYKLRFPSGAETEWIKSRPTNERLRKEIMDGGFRGRIEILEQAKHAEPARVVA